MSYLYKNRPSIKHTRAGFVNIIMLCTGLVISASITIGCVIKCTYKQTLEIIAPPAPFQKAYNAINQEDPQALAEILDYSDEQEPGLIADIDAWYHGKLSYDQRTLLLRHAIMNLPADDEVFDPFTSQNKQVTTRLKDIAMKSIADRRAIRGKLLKTGIKITDAIPDDYVFKLITGNEDDAILFSKLRRIAPYRALYSLVDHPNNENLLHVVTRGAVRPKTVAFLLAQGVDASHCNFHGNTPLHLFLIHLPPAHPNSDANLLHIISLLYEYGNRNFDTPDQDGDSARDLVRTGSAMAQFLENPELYKRNNPHVARLVAQSNHYSNTIKLDKNIVHQLHNRQIYGPSHR